MEYLKQGYCSVLKKQCGELIQSNKQLLEEKELEFKGLKEKYKTTYDYYIETKEGYEKLSEYNRLQEELNKVIAYNLSIGKIKEKYDQDIKAIEGELNPYIEIYEDELKDKIELDSDIAILSGTLDKNNYLLPYYKFWVKGYGKEGIPNLKIEAFLEQIEGETNQILSEIADRTFVKIESQSTTATGEAREKISYEVISQDKQITDYLSYSGGQKQRVKLADMLAFNKLLGKFSFIILDEILELSLDDVGKGQVLELLKRKYLSGDIQTMMVISHDEQLKSDFEKVINIELREGKSYIKE